MRHLNRRVSLHTLGCKLNQAETSALGVGFISRGYAIVPFHEPAEITYINTCTVTNEAAAKSRQTIRQAIQASPQGKIVVAGCYAQISPEEISRLEGVDLILGSAEKFKLFDYLDSLGEEENSEPLVYVNDHREIQEYADSPYTAIGSRTRAFLKVQDGCDYNCSYCVIPVARGRARSRPLDACLNEARDMVYQGYKELVLTGVNLGTWSAGQFVFHDLVDRLSRIEGIERIRISSIEVNLITDQLISLVRERENICPHFHVPLQHSSDNILSAMRRRYNFSFYSKKLEQIASAIQGVGIGADVIVGFPGETAEDFQHLAESLIELPTTYHHIFRYSERRGTVAAMLTDPIPVAERKARSQILHEISRKKSSKFVKQFIGQLRHVHLESVHDKRISGMTDNYLRVELAADECTPGDIVPVELIGLTANGLSGVLADQRIAK
ncbi:tRNA (N(6)-L-threonylcarbamoyladenosine(37)-C(2))-methylthiotransferase MtaB [Candidatus Neomarinimicrobiota bacterium]